MWSINIIKEIIYAWQLSIISEQVIRLEHKMEKGEA